MAGLDTPGGDRQDRDMTADAAATGTPALVERHRAQLDGALEAIRTREHWSAFDESPSPRIWGEDAAKNGQHAFEQYLGQRFDLDQPGTASWAGEERSPFGVEFGVTYPHADPDVLLPAMAAGMPAWRDAGPDVRAAVCQEILARLGRRSFELANAVMHTTGQAFVMAFQAGGAHALDRALEAVAYAYAEMTRHAPTSHWVKPQGKRPPLSMRKTFHVVPRGVALVVGCNTFPTWNGFPGLFASLVTGNPVLVKPSPRAVLPLAITVRIAREVLAEYGFDPNLVALTVDEPGRPSAKELAVRPEIRIIDYTGSTGFGDWLEDNARQAHVYAEKAGVNTVVVDSTDDFRGMCGNLAFSLSLYSGQMCTTPQNILVPRTGIGTNEGHKSFEEVGAGIAGAVDKLLGDDARAVEIIGGVVNDGVLERLDEAGGHGDVVLASRTVTHPQFPGATVRTPTVLAVDAKDAGTYTKEWFGPISFLIGTEDTAASLRIFGETVTEHGALTAAVYSVDEDVLTAAETAAVDAGVALSCNLTGGVFVNQSAAFSDFHATGANPAANSALTDGAYVANRFRIVQSRRHVPAE
jgi:phenylacetic acid degradation protein paaN